MVRVSCIANETKYSRIDKVGWLAHLVSRFACNASVIVDVSLSPPVSRIKIAVTKT